MKYSKKIFSSLLCLLLLFTSSNASADYNNLEVLGYSDGDDVSLNGLKLNGSIDEFAAKLKKMGCKEIINNDRVYYSCKKYDHILNDGDSFTLVPNDFNPNEVAGVYLYRPFSLGLEHIAANNYFATCRKLLSDKSKYELESGCKFYDRNTDFETIKESMKYSSFNVLPSAKEQSKVAELANKHLDTFAKNIDQTTKSKVIAEVMKYYNKNRRRGSINMYFSEGTPDTGHCHIMIQYFRMSVPELAGYFNN